MTCSYICWDKIELLVIVFLSLTKSGSFYFSYLVKPRKKTNLTCIYYLLITLCPFSWVPLWERLFLIVLYEVVGCIIFNVLEQKFADPSLPKLLLTLPSHKFYLQNFLLYFFAMFRDPKRPPTITCPLSSWLKTSTTVSLHCI